MTGEIIGVVLCDEVAEFCRCQEARGHQTPHVCECGGSWRGTYGTGNFEAIAFPNPLWSRNE